jgi:hypothetical protein
MDHSPAIPRIIHGHVESPRTTEEVRGLFQRAGELIVSVTVAPDAKGPFKHEPVELTVSTDPELVEINEHARTIAGFTPDSSSVIFYLSPDPDNPAEVSYVSE